MIFIAKVTHKPSVAKTIKFIVTPVQESKHVDNAGLSLLIIEGNNETIKTTLVIDSA